MDPVLLLLQDLLLSTFNTLQATGTTHLCPALCDVPALVLVFWVFFELLVFLFGIFFDGKSRAGVNWRMGVYAPPHRKFIFALLHCFFDATGPRLSIPTVLMGSQRRNLTGPQYDMSWGQGRSGQGY